ncbi:MAG: glutaredoxin [bacterium]|nr:glutaredoxin [bacterium]
MKLLDNNTIGVLEKIFGNFKRDVTLKFFGTTKGIQSRFSRETKSLVEGVGKISDRVKPEFYDFDTDGPAVEEFRIQRAPAIVVMGDEDYGIRFYGVPGGHEFNSFVESLKLVASGEDMLVQDTRDFLDTLDMDFHFQVFVNPGCTKCPRMVAIVHRMAFHSPRVRADMIEATNFQELAQQYDIMGVPHTVINETGSLIGLCLEDKVVEKMKAHID